jgi:hypothetical protein
MVTLALDSAQPLVLALFHAERAAERNPRACVLGIAPQRAPNAFAAGHASSRDTQAALDYIDSIRTKSQLIIKACAHASSIFLCSEHRSENYREPIASSGTVGSAAIISLGRARRATQWPASWLTTTSKATSWCCCTASGAPWVGSTADISNLHSLHLPFHHMSARYDL